MRRLTRPATRAIGFVHVAFVIDTFASHIVGWRVSGWPRRTPLWMRWRSDKRTAPRW